MGRESTGLVLTTGHVDSTRFAGMWEQTWEREPLSAVRAVLLEEQGPQSLEPLIAFAPHIDLRWISTLPVSLVGTDEFVGKCVLVVRARVNLTLDPVEDL